MANPFDILKNAQHLQTEFTKIQDETKLLTAVGTSGGGIVKLTVNGQFEIVDIELDPIAVDPRDISMLQDLIVAAHHNAIEKVKALMQSKLGPMLGGLNIPGLT